MKIALDYDGTYTAEPKLFDNFIRMAKQFGHEIFIVTMRYNNEQEQIKEAIECPIIYTGRQAKIKFMAALGHFDIQIWIDDKPQLLYDDASLIK